MAEDAIRGLGWAEEEITGISDYADQVDDPFLGLPHNQGSCHRVEKYQREFELYGGDVCTYMGAESWAAGFGSLAETAYASGNTELGKKNLGYAMHFIQDALCPPHVFPFSENLIHGLASAEFETYALASYNVLGSSWPAFVESAQPEWIADAEDLHQKVEEAADWVNATFQPPQCSYIRQDGTIIGDLSGDALWYMADEDIVECMQKAAGLVKGAARWAHPQADLGKIYIRADGNIEPLIAAISSTDGVTYTLTEDIGTYGIIIEKDNIAIEGRNYTLQGTSTAESYRGLDLSFRSNITIRNLKVTGFWQAGIYLWYSSSINIFGNDVRANTYSGIVGYKSNSSSISGNSLENNAYGIYFYEYHYYNRIFGNDITANGAFGIGLDFGTGIGYLNNDVYENRITANYGDKSDGFYGGIWLRGRSNNSIHANNIVGNWCGIYLYTGSNNKICNNNFIDNTYHVRDAHSDYSNIPSSVNIWDDGYPSGGNYWGDYSGVDLCRGPYQNETGSDGIGDTPYTIDIDNRDGYPLMNAYAFGDIDYDGTVNVRDVYALGKAFISTPVNPEWNVRADLNKDDIIDNADLAMLSNCFGKRAP